MKVGRDVSARCESCGKKNRAGKRPEAREKKKKRGCWAGETKRHFFFFRFSSSSGALFALSLHGALSLFYAIEHEMGASSHLEMKKERGSKRGAERRKSRAFFFFEGREKKMKRRKKKKASYFLFLPLRRQTFPQLESSESSRAPLEDGAPFPPRHGHEPRAAASGAVRFGCSRGSRSSVRRSCFSSLESLSTAENDDGAAARRHPALGECSLPGSRARGASDRQQAQVAGVRWGAEGGGRRGAEERERENEKNETFRQLRVIFRFLQRTRRASFPSFPVPTSLCRSKHST